MTACTWCGDTAGRKVVRRDAANSRHLFHLRCWHAQRAWLRGWDPPAKLGPAWDHPGGPVRMRGFNR